MLYNYSPLCYTMRGFGTLLCLAYTKAADRRTVRAVERTRRAVLLRITANKALQTTTTACVLRRPLLLSKALYNFNPLWYTMHEFVMLCAVIS